LLGGTAAGCVGGMMGSVAVWRLMRYVAVPCVALHCVALRCIALKFMCVCCYLRRAAFPRSVEVYFIDTRCTMPLNAALYYIALLCIVPYLLHLKVLCWMCPTCLCFFSILATNHIFAALGCCQSVVTEKYSAEIISFCVFCSVDSSIFATTTCYVIPA
jgi:hypothetical protein